MDPGGIHCLDVLAVTGDMAVFGRVVLADDKMRHIGSKVEFVDASEVNNLLSNLDLSCGKGIRY
jgi:hypothetical protein